MSRMYASDGLRSWLLWTTVAFVLRKMGGRDTFTLGCFEHCAGSILDTPIHLQIALFTCHQSSFRETDQTNTVAMKAAILSVLSLASFLLPAQALYFYIDGPTQKCFFEELPKDTLVVGASNPSLFQRRLKFPWIALTNARSRPL